MVTGRASAVVYYVPTEETWRGRQLSLFVDVIRRHGLASCLYAGDVFWRGPHPQRVPCKSPSCYNKAWILCMLLKDVDWKSKVSMTASYDSAICNKKIKSHIQATELRASNPGCTLFMTCNKFWLPSSLLKAGFGLGWVVLTTIPPWHGGTSTSPKDRRESRWGVMYPNNGTE